jgi:transcriptional regulator with XRE-family HTH domain
MEATTISARIGQRIKLYRKQRKMTLETLASCIRRSKATVSKYEHGSIVMDVETLSDIAQALQIPITCLMDPTPTAIGSSITVNVLPPRLYFYIYRDRGTQDIACSYLDTVHRDGRCQAVLYYDVPTAHPQKTHLIYTGEAFVTDTTFTLLMTNYRNQLDQMYFSSARPYINQNDYFVGFWVGLTFESVTPVCMKAVISERPIEDKTLLHNLLTVTQRELAYFRKKNKFLLQAGD